MVRTCGWSAAITAALLLNACVLNSVRALPRGDAISERHAIVVLGLEAQARTSFGGFGVQLEQYDVKAQLATGDCFRFNRIEASLPSTPGPIQYFAYEVPPGAYVYSAFNATPLASASASNTPAFNAPEGAIVYLGDFIYSHDKLVQLRRDSTVLKQEAVTAIIRSLPELKGELRLADVQTVKPPLPFLCTP